MIRVQREDFDIGAELDRLAAGNHAIGGIASFVGLVRDLGGPDRVAALSLEHYPGMTEKKLAEIELEAHRRWPLTASLIIHRYGRLEPGERIVLVATASPHREAALAACHFLIDWLKTDAPFWKSGQTPAGERWVERRAEDDAAKARWPGSPARHSTAGTSGRQPHRPHPGVASLCSLPGAAPYMVRGTRRGCLGISGCRRPKS